MDFERWAWSYNCPSISEGRWSIAQLDKFIAALISKKGSELLLVADNPPQLTVEGRQSPLMDKRPTGAQVRRLVGEITPASAQASLRGLGEASFLYAAPAGKNVDIAVTGWDVEVRVRITPAVEPTDAGLEWQLESNSAVAPLGGAAAALDAGTLAGRQSGSAPSSIRPAVGRGSTAQMAAGAKNPGDKPIDRLFRKLVAIGASDLHISSGEVPMTRVDGDMSRLKGEEVLSPEQLYQLLLPIIPETNLEQFEAENDTDFAYEIEGLARFRANIFRDRHGVGAVFRTIPADIISAEQLGLSKHVKELCTLHKGLVLVTGPTGSGKSTTLCALVDLINRTRAAHIITIEDPIEFVHENKQCLINQREIGKHTGSFKRALRAALREDPDVVLVGEMRDLETIAIAIETAETGHLVFGTLHTTTAYSTIDRIIDQYPPDQQEQIRVMLSESLKGVVSQTLCKKIGGGRVAALEFLSVTPAVSNLIREAKTFQIPSIMQTSKNLGMCLLNDALVDLVVKKQVTVEEAISKAVDKKSLTTSLKNKDLMS